MALNSIVQKVKSKIPQFLFEEKTYFWIFVVVSILIGFQKVIQGPKFYNNYLIFKTAFSHLICEQNLYIYYWNEYGDLYLYSPTFAVLMAPLTYLPIVAQVFLWCGLSAGLLFLAIRSLPILEEKKRVFIYAFILIEYITSLQSMQVTAIMLACMLFSFTAFEKGKMSRAAFCIMLATFIKIYAIVAAIMFLMYPQKIKFLGYFVFWFIIFLFLPLLFISLDQFIWQYQNWYNVMTGIHRSEETGIHPNVDMPLSVMGWLKAWFHYNPPSIYIQLLGTALLCTPLVRFKSFINLNFRLYILSSILIWSMIFNHIAESPSYIVAVLGVAIWYTIKGNNAASNFLIITVFILTILSPTSLFPRFIRDSYILPYALKAVPCIAVWVVLQYTLLSKRFTTTLSGNL